MSARDPALDTAGRFGAFLDRTIKEFRTTPPVNELPKITPLDEFQPMHAERASAVPTPAAKPLVNKFTELAKKLKANQAFMHKEADSLSAEADDVMPQFIEAVGKHRSLLQNAKAGVKDMQDAANILSNFDPNEQSKD